MLLGMGRRTWIVVYSSGDRTECVDKRTAKSYARMFNGEAMKFKKWLAAEDRKKEDGGANVLP